MTKVYGRDGRVYDNFKEVNKAFKSGGVSVAVSVDEDFNRVSDVLFGMVKVDVGGFVFGDGDSVGVGQLSDDAFSGRCNLKNKIISVIVDRTWADGDLSKFKRLCVNANRFGCLIIVNNVELNRLGGVVDFTVGGSGVVEVEDLSSGSSVGRLGSGAGSFNGSLSGSDSRNGSLNSGSRGSGLLGRWRS